MTIHKSTQLPWASRTPPTLVVLFLAGKHFVTQTWEAAIVVWVTLADAMITIVRKKRVLDSGLSDLVEPCEWCVILPIFGHPDFVGVGDRRGNATQKKEP